MEPICEGCSHLRTGHGSDGCTAGWRLTIRGDEMIKGCTCRIIGWAP